MSALTESRKRDASAFLADNDRLISKRMRRGVRLFSPPPPPPPPPSISNPSVPDYSSVNSEGSDLSMANFAREVVSQPQLSVPSYKWFHKLNSTTNPLSMVEDPSTVKKSNSAVLDNLPADGEQWVEVFVKDMMRASDINDAKNRSFRLLEMFEKSVTERNASEATKTFQEEHNRLQEQLDSLLHENGILKRAVAIQHERLKEYGDKVKESDGLKQTLSQYQEKIRTLEMNNYALAMHLKHAQGNGAIHGHFNRDIF